MFLLAYILTQSNANPLLQKNQIPKQPTQLAVLTMPDNVLRLCAARVDKFYDLTKLWLQNVQDEIEMLRMFIKYCLSKIVMLQKMRKNKDTNHI